MRMNNFVSLPHFRQILAAVATNLHSLSTGSVFGYSSVLLPQLKEDKTIVYEVHYDSWIAAITPLSMALGCAIAGPFIDRFGRRTGLIFLVIPFVFGWLTMGFSNNIHLLLLGRAVSGIGAGAFRTMSLVYLSEVTDPKIRAMSLLSISFTGNIGVLLSHVAGTYLYWKTASFVFCMPNLLAVVILFYLKESPLWLISKDRVREGSDIFYWFRAKSESADKEINAVLTKQSKSSQDLNLKDTIKIVFSRAFMVPFAICIVIFIEAQFCGANILSFYALDMIKRTFSGNIDSFLVMIIIDTIRVIGSVAVFCIVSYLPRRFIFMLCSFLTTVFIFCMAIYSYFELSNLLWFGLISLVLYKFFSTTLISTGWSFTSEVYPSSVRGLGSAATSSMAYILLFIAVKITPGLIDAYGMFVFNIFSGCITAVCSVILYFVLPETNGKTLQEIEDDINKEKWNNTPITCEQTRV